MKKREAVTRETAASHMLFPSLTACARSAAPAGAGSITVSRAKRQSRPLNGISGGGRGSSTPSRKPPMTSTASANCASGTLPANNPNAAALVSGFDLGCNPLASSSNASCNTSSEGLSPQMLFHFYKIKLYDKVARARRKSCGLSIMRPNRSKPLSECGIRLISYTNKKG